MQNLKFDKSWLLFAAAAAIFLIIKITAAGYSVSDENTYYKMGQLVASGQVPYRDFFFAHPPLHVYLYAIVFKLFGFNFLLLKMISAIAVVITAAFVFAITKDKLNSKVAAAATALFLFSYGTMLFSNFPTGAEFATGFSTAVLYLFIQKRFLASGALIGLAAATSLLGAIMLPMLAAAAVLFLKDKKALMRLLIGFAVVFAAVNGLFLLAAKGEFVEQVYIYHLKKPAEDVDKTAIFLRVIKTNLLLFAAAAAAIISRNRNKVFLPLAIAAAYIAAFPAIKTSFNYYLLYAFPFLAVAGGYGLLRLQELLTEKAKLRQGVAIAAIAAIVVTSGFTAARQFNSYDFQDFTHAEEIAAYVRTNSMPGQTIFGDDSTVPLISLLSGREITLNYVDNNALRYRSGATDLGETLRMLDSKIRENELKFIIIRKILIDKTASLEIDFGIATLDEFSSFLRKSCKLAKEFPLEWRGLVQAYEAYDCLKT